MLKADFITTVPLVRIGIILHLEKNEADEAEEWFKKAEKTDSLFPSAAYEYGCRRWILKITFDKSTPYR